MTKFSDNLMKMIDSDEYAKFLKEQKRFKNAVKRSAVRYVRDVHNFDVEERKRNFPGYDSYDVVVDDDPNGKVVVRWLSANEQHMRNEPVVNQVWTMDSKTVLDYNYNNA